MMFVLCCHGVIWPVFVAHGFDVTMLELAVALRSKGVVYQVAFEVLCGDKNSAYGPFCDAARQLGVIHHLDKHGQVVGFDQDGRLPVIYIYIRASI